MHGKLATVIDQIEHGHHVFRAYFKSSFLPRRLKLTREYGHGLGGSR